MVIIEKYCNLILDTSPELHRTFSTFKILSNCLIETVTSTQSERNIKIYCPRRGSLGHLDWL